jgi:hypothetical protein
MKQILLLVAIYSLIIHQSHKNAKGKEMAPKKTTTKSISSQTNSYTKQIVSPDLHYGKADYVRGGSNMNVYARWENKE